MARNQSERPGNQREMPADLPLAVTNISPQKKNPDRYSLFHKKRFLIGISRKTRTNFSIEEGTLLTEPLYKQLSEAEERSAIREACLRYLARRDHSSSELLKKVGKKGYRQADIRDVVRNLARQGLIDDKEFAERFVSDKMELNRWGPKKIRAKLYQKGVDREIIESVLENALDDKELQSACIHLVLKRKRHFLREDDLFKRKEKIYRYLSGRGYSGSVIHSAWPEIEKQLNV